MPNVTASRARQKFGEILEQAQRDPVFVSRHGKQIAVVLSFEAMMRLTGVGKRGPVRPEVEKLLADAIKRRASVFRALTKLG